MQKNRFWGDFSLFLPWLWQIPPELFRRGNERNKGLLHHHDKYRDRKNAADGIKDISAIGRFATIDITVFDGIKNVTDIGRIAFIDIGAIKSKKDVAGIGRVTVFFYDFTINQVHN